MNSLVSIIMPAYNCEEYICEAIDSILSQSYQNIELLIADDASSDGTKSIIEGYSDSRIKMFHNDGNMGYLQTCNKLFEKCNGEYITFQDADDWSAKDRIASQVEAITQSSLGICGTFLEFVNPDGSPATASKILPVSDQDIREKMRSTNPFCGASIMITKDAYEKVGGYDPFFSRIGNEDYYWASRIVDKYTALNIDRPLYFVRANPNSVTRTIKNVRQLLSVEIVHFLIENGDKIEHSKNSIDPKDPLLKGFIEQLEKPFIQDASLIYRKEADMRAYYGDFVGSFQSARKAFMARPWYLINLKYLLTTATRIINK
ncbi:MAG: glycosyltransferase family 2 protein [Reichenbachiella sp.]|uniref:glycosyltransferase family 2 protein n=1 Tax=Reichenbachiella sp. TaxID=2184521 RepID=UPI003263A62D